MATQSCPKCDAPNQSLLESASKHAYVNYYRCPTCGHIWTLPKDGSRTIPWDVTVDKKPDED